MGTRHRILTPHEAAEKAGVTPAELAALMTSDDGPAYIAMGPRLIRYLEVDVETWMRERAQPPGPHGNTNQH
jgi:predicted DNA-binding transcriptional regulator AlpA